MTWKNYERWKREKGCLNKTPLHGEEYAAKAAADIAARSGLPFKHYKCSYCDGFHLTTRTKERTFVPSHSQAPMIDLSNERR